MDSINRCLIRSLQREIETIRRDRDIRLVIITGAGERAFCAGADLKERIEMDDMEVIEFIFNLGSSFTAIETLNRPIIAAINGLALGAGLKLALACDILLASGIALPGLPETRLAIIPGGGGTQRLPRVVGPGKARELIFTGRRIGADEAFDIGLVNRVCPGPDLLGECRMMAEIICEAGPIAIEQAKHAIRQGMETDLHSGLAIESNAYKVTIATQDRIEGLRAFKEKRKTVYRGC